MKDVITVTSVILLWIGIIIGSIFVPVHTIKLDDRRFTCTDTKYTSKELNEKFAPYCIQYTKTEGK